MARGSVRAGSDLDLAFLPVDGMDEIGVNAEVVRLTHWNDVDAINLARADPLTLFEVARNGTLLFGENEATFNEFRSLAFRRWMDTEKLRRAQRRALDIFQERHESR